MTATLPTDPRPWTTSDRLRWIADFIGLAGKAISIIACVQGIEYPGQLHTTAQSDLRAWARWLDTRPDLASEMDAVRLVLAAEADDSSQKQSHSTLPTTRPSPSAPPPVVEGEGSFMPGLLTHERGFDVVPQRTAGA
ncbi:MAG: hypothetical protein ACLPUG_11710 [Acidimicrobiales bacterium]